MRSRAQRQNTKTLAKLAAAKAGHERHRKRLARLTAELPSDKAALRLEAEAAYQKWRSIHDSR